MAAFHGLEELPVRCETVTADELRDRLLQQMEASLSVPLATQLEVAFRMGLTRGHTPSEIHGPLLDFLAQQVLGYYDPVRDMVVLARAPQGGQLLPGMDVLVWSHELEHAYQQRRHRLGSRLYRLKNNSDAQLAASAVAEGDAVLVMAAVGVASERPTPRELADAADQILTLLGTIREGAAPPEVPQVFVDQLIFPYEQGTRYIGERLRAGGWRAVERVMDQPPSSTEQLLHPDRRTDQPVVLGDEDLPRLEGWDVVQVDVSGEWGLGEWLACALPRNEAERAAAGWDGDYGRVARRTGAPDVWRFDMASVWDSEKDAQEAESALRTALPELLRLGPDGTDVSVRREGTHVAVKAVGRTEKTAEDKPFTRAETDGSGLR